MGRPASFALLASLLLVVAAASVQNLRREQEVLAVDESMFWSQFGDDYLIDGKKPEYRLPNGAQGEIIGGTAATSGEYPYFVSLESGGQIYCGGSLISATKVLSAAHCFTQNDGSIILPDQVRINHIDTSGGETVGVSCVSIHPDYTNNLNGLFSDIAVLTLSAAATTTSFVSINTDTSQPSTSGQALTAIGFGRTVSGGATSSTLQKASEAFVTEADCQEDWSCADSALHVCAAKGTNVGVCQGK